LLGWRYHDATLQAFSHERDYDAAIRFAVHLSKPVFDGYEYQDRAKELAQQLKVRRGEDFKTLALPTTRQWPQIRAAMTRDKQIEFLGQRLRLLNCFQWGQPGGV